MSRSFFVFLFCLFAQASNAQTIVFVGTPTVKITESGLERTVDKVENSKELSLACVVREVDGKYFWESRGNKQLIKVDSGAFLIYQTLDGSGYVRLIKPSMKEPASSLSNTEKNFDYVEHVIFGLRAITYYGKNKSF